MAASAACAVSITSRTLFSLRSVQAISCDDARSGAGIILTLQAASSWPIPVIYGPTPPDNVTSRICCAEINPLRRFNVVIVASPKPTASSCCGRSDSINIWAAPIPKRRPISASGNAGSTRIFCNAKWLRKAFSYSRHPSKRELICTRIIPD
ncbi:Uncharacterised protein [Salmonella enterica subsp. enterica serovar Typhimurium str. DT104]|nr:Uncharacterised protein [Salmonella enterica subsp. enterica serovar Typhimurium str. DT104]